MGARSISETKRFRYLLGLSSPAEREQIEAEYFEDEDAFQEMLTAEDDLIDAYARGELAADERRRFEEGSLDGTDRVQFARAFAGAVSAGRLVEPKYRGTWLDILKTFQSPALLRTATIAAVVVLVASVAWLVIDRRSMTNELRELRAESAELWKQAEALQRSSDAESTRTAEISAKLADLQADPAKPRHRERRTIATQRARRSSAVKNDRETIASSKPDQAEEHSNTQDASLGNSFVSRQITQLPLEGRNVPNLSTLQPGRTGGYLLAAKRADAKTTLDDIWLEPRNTYSLKPRNTNSSSDNTIHIPSSLGWVRFRITLEKGTSHKHYRANIETTDGRHIKSVDCFEPLTANQTIIDTPVISLEDLPSADYVLVLTGREPDGSFVKVADYSFKVTRD